MKTYARTLDLQDVLKQTKTLGVSGMAEIIADRLEKVEDFGVQKQDNKKEQLVQNFRTLSKDEGANFDEFNHLMAQLADWGESYVGEHLQKTCWVKAFQP